MSSIAASPRSAMAIAAAKFGTSNRLTIKPGVSLHRTVILPVSLAQPSTRSTTSGSTSGVCTTSHSFMSWTGLK